MVVIHFITEGILTFLLITLFINYFRLVKDMSSLIVANDEVIRQAEYMIEYIQAIENELKLTKETRDLYWEDRNSLMDSIKAMRGDFGNDFKTDL